MKCQIPQISWHSRDPVLSVDFQMVNGDVRRLATGGTDAHVIIWYVTLSDAAINVECACDLVRHNKSVNVVRFSPNGEFLASGDDEGSIFIWKMYETSQNDQGADLFDEEKSNKESWKPFKLLRGHLDDVSDLSWSPNSTHLLSGSIDNIVFIWDIQKGQNSRVSKDAKSFVQGVTWDPLNQYFASMSCDRMLRIYSVKTKKLLQRVFKAPWPCPPSEKNGGPRVARLFHDDTLQSFCRRLNFTPDGQLLFVPSGIKEKADDKLVHTTYVFSRHNLSNPVLSLPTGNKYTVAVRCCPVLYKLRPVQAAKEMIPMIDLPYRVLIAVVSQDSLFLYDTQQLSPMAYISNIHYTHLTDLSWSSDGRIIIISSTDGYCSFVVFTEDELGEIYVPEPVPEVLETPKEPMEVNDVPSKDTIDCKVTIAEKNGVGVTDEIGMKENVDSFLEVAKKPKLRTIDTFFTIPPNKTATKKMTNDVEVLKNGVETLQPPEKRAKLIEVRRITMKKIPIEKSDPKLMEKSEEVVEENKTMSLEVIQQLDEMVEVVEKNSVEALEPTKKKAKLIEVRRIITKKIPTEKSDPKMMEKSEEVVEENKTISLEVIQQLDEMVEIVENNSVEALEPIGKKAKLMEVRRIITTKIPIEKDDVCVEKSEANFDKIEEENETMSLEVKQLDEMVEVVEKNVKLAKIEEHNIPKEIENQAELTGIIN